MVIRAARFAAFAGLSAVLGCGHGGDAPSRHTLIDSRETYDPRSLDPAHANDIPSGRLVSYLYDGLLRFAPDGKLTPALAARWTVSSDGRTYTFHLRRHVAFHDGSLLTARTVVHSLTRALDPATHGIPLWPLYPIAGAREFSGGHATAVTGLASPDDSTVVITLVEPLGIFPKLLAMPVAAIVPEHAGDSLSEHPVGTGPWRFVEWRHDDYIKMARNPTYFGGAPRSDSLETRIIPESSTAVAEFESGNVDLLYVPEGDTREWMTADAKKALLQSPPPLRLWYVAINTTRGPLTDPRVRQALNLAVDRRAILDQMLSARGTLAAGVVPGTLEGGDTTRAPYPFDSAHARALLAAAGHAGGIDVSLWCSLDPPMPRVAEALQAYWRAIGVRATIVQRDASSMRDAARNGKTDLVLKDWYADYPDAENFLYPLLYSGNAGVGGNVSFYTNPTFDRLITTARRETDDARRAVGYRQADSLEFADAPMVYLFFYNELYAVQPWIHGFRAPSIFTGQPWIDVSIGN